MKKIKIGERSIGEGEPCFIIAEAGINHNGQLELAKKMVEAAKKCGADAIKFQTFKTEEFIADKQLKWTYEREGKKITENQYDMFKKVELSYEDHVELLEHCKKVGIQFLSTATSPEAVDILEKLGVPAFKIGSDDLTNYPLLEYVASKGKPIILSTGMSDLEMVKRSIDVIRKSGNDDVIVLHCISQYPTPPGEVNLRAIKTMEKELDLPIGFSDHTEGVYVPIAAVVVGACVIEKHFTLDKKLPGPDQELSADPKEVSELVKGIRTVELALGSGIKKPTKFEDAIGIRVTRRSIVAKKDIFKGELIRPEHLTLKRPGDGLSPDLLTKVIGSTAKTDIKQDEMLTKEMFKPKKIVCIVQARTGSTRLPSKVTKEICGKTVLELLIERLKQSSKIDDIIIATTTNPKDKVIAELAERNGIKFFRGSEEDVLGRYYGAAKAVNADIIVRVTSDCPLLDVDGMDSLIDHFLMDEVDYAVDIGDTGVHFNPNGMPLGLGSEVMKFSALERAQLSNADAAQREHVTLYLEENPDKFKLRYYDSPEYARGNNFRLTLDTPEDFELIKAIYENLYKGRPISLKKVFEFLETNPRLARSNMHVGQKKARG